MDSKNQYREEPAVVRYRTAGIARNVFEQQKTALEYSAKYLDNWLYENDELTPLFNDVFSDNDKRLSSLDSAIKIVDSDLSRLSETSEVKAYHNWSKANKGGFVLGYIGGIVLALGSCCYIIRLENEKTKSLREQSRLKNPEQ